MVYSDILRTASGRMIDWSDIRYFSRDEWCGHVEETAALLIYSLDLYRHTLGFPVYISPANWGQHSKNSYHNLLPARNGLCWAVDIFPKCELGWAYHIAIRSKVFGGVGVYPFWQYTSKELIGGLHLDIRKYQMNNVVWYYDGPIGQGEYKYIHTVKQYLAFISLLMGTGAV